jgi:hypothetical protein
MVSADRPAGAALASKNVALAVDGLENRERKRVLGTLEAYRGLAALVVVIIHGTSVLVRTNDRVGACEVDRARGKVD